MTSWAISSCRFGLLRPAYEGPSAPWAYRSALLALLIVIVGVSTALLQQRAIQVQDRPHFSFLVVPLGDMVLFTIFVGTALYFRRRLHIHKRLMLFRRAFLLTAAIARIPEFYFDRRSTGVL